MRRQERKRGAMGPGDADRGIWGQRCLLLYTEIVKLPVVGLGRSSAYCFRPHTASSSNQNQFSESQDRGLWGRATLPAYCKTVMEVPMGFRERFHHSSIVGLIKPTSPPPIQIRLPPPMILNSWRFGGIQRSELVRKKLLRGRFQGRGPTSFIY
jgi:hypothetical protein